MKVRDILTPNPHTVKEDTSFRDVAELIFTHHISGLPVVNDAGQCIGMISEKDLLQTIFPTYSELMQTDSDTPLYAMDLENLEHHAQEVNHLKVRDLMKREVIMVDPDTPILQAASMMIVYRVRRLPVVENNRLIGIISQGDVFRAILQKEFGFGKKKEDE